MDKLPSDYMLYEAFEDNPYLAYWSKFKTESVISITEPPSAEKSVIINANRTCIIPGGCVFFHLKERLGDITITRLHRGNIGLIPFDNTQAKLCIIVGQGSQNYPEYKTTYGEVDIDYRVYQTYAIAYINKLVGSTWYHDPDIPYETELTDANEDAIVKSWNSDKYISSDSDLFTIMQKSCLFNSEPILNDESTISSLLVRVPSGWEPLKSSLYDPNYDYHNISSISGGDTLENDRGKILQYIRESPFLATPLVMTSLVREGCAAFALPRWVIQTTITCSIRAQGYNEGYGGFPGRGEPVFYFHFGTYSGTTLNDSATSITISFTLNEAGTKELTIPISSQIVPESPLREETISYTDFIYSHEVDYLHKPYYRSIYGVSLWVDLSQFGFSIPLYFHMNRNLNSPLTTMSITQNNPDYIICTDQSLIVDSDVIFDEKERTRQLVLDDNSSSDLNFINLSTREDYNPDFPEGYVTFYATYDKPLSLLEGSIVSINLDNSRGFESEYTLFGIDRILNLTDTFGGALEKITYYYIVLPRLGIPNKSSFINPAPDYTGNNPEWNDRPFKRFVFEDETIIDYGDLGKLMNNSDADVLGTPWPSTKISCLGETYNWNYIPATGLEGDTLTYNIVFRAANMGYSFNEEATYSLSHEDLELPQLGLFCSASYHTQYGDPYYENGGRIYFHVPLDKWYVREEQYNEKTEEWEQVIVYPSAVSPVEYPGYTHSGSVQLYEMWNGYFRDCGTGATVFYTMPTT